MAWKKALKKAGIDNFRCHDLRHTWASWHVQNGTSLQELQQLGGWASFEMVLSYADLSSDYLKELLKEFLSQICHTCILRYVQPLSASFCLLVALGTRMRPVL